MFTDVRSKNLLPKCEKNIMHTQLGRCKCTWNCVHSVYMRLVNLPVLTDFMNTIITSDESWMYGYYPKTKSFSLQWKFDESTKHYLLNWCYWQAGKYLHMCMKVQGRFMQAHLTEIHHVFAKKKVEYFSNSSM